MLASLFRLAEKSPLVRWSGLVLVLACLGTGCCRKCNLRGEGFPEDEFSSMPRKMRPVDPDTEAFSFSKKARQVERDLGCRD